MLKKSFLSSLAICISLVVVESSQAQTLAPEPLFDDFGTFTTILPDNGDLTDIYYPLAESSFHDFPLVLFLQGALVDASFYSEYASQVARYGFVVAVPNHFRTIPGFGSGLFPEVSQIDATINAFSLENSNPSSPLFNIIDMNNFGLLGHSFGGAVGLSAIANRCIPFICFEDDYQRPSSLQAGVFFGANLRNQTTNEPIPINNDGIGIALLQGDLDSIASASNAQATFDNINTPPAALISLAGVNHFGITNINNPSGAQADSNIPTVAQTVSIETTARWSGLFLRSTLLEDQEASNYVFNSGEAFDPNVSQVQALAVSEPRSIWGTTISLGLLGSFFLFRRFTY